MALYSRVHVWVSNEVLTASDLNAEFNQILNNADAAHLIGASANVSAMQAVADPGGVGSESLAGSVTEELQRIRYMLKFLSGKTQWYDHTGANLGSGGVPRTSLVAVGQQISSSSGSFSGGNGSAAAVTNLSVSLTTSGRPVRLELIGDGSGGTSLVGITGGVNSTGWVAFYEGTNELCRLQTGYFSGTGAVVEPASAYHHIYVPAAGTYTYTVKVFGVSSNVAVQWVKLIAYEL